MKARYRAWLAGRKLNDEIPNEEEAVKQVCEIFKNISTDLVRSSWRMTGFKKFAHFEEASDPQVSSQDIENELNERLELACSITEAWKLISRYFESLCVICLCIIFENKKIFRLSPNFLDMDCFAKTLESQFFGHGLFGENAKFPIFWSEIESQF